MPFHKTWIVGVYDDIDAAYDRVSDTLPSVFWTKKEWHALIVEKLRINSVRNRENRQYEEDLSNSSGNLWYDTV